MNTITDRVMNRLDTPVKLERLEIRVLFLAQVKDTTLRLSQKTGLGYYTTIKACRRLEELKLIQTEIVNYERVVVQTPVTVIQFN